MASTGCTLVPISNLNVSSRATLVAVVRKILSRETSSGSKMLIVELEDNSGSITATGFDEAHDKWVDKILEGSTYKLSNMQIKSNAVRNNSLEVKLYADSKIGEHCDLLVTKKFGTIRDAKDSGKNVVRFAAVLSEINDPTVSSTGNPMRKGVVIDPTDEVSIFIFGESNSGNPGDIFNIEGRVGKGGVFVDEMTKVTNDDLSTFWTTDASDKIAKRQKLQIPISSIEECGKATVGQRLDAKCVIRTASISTEKAGNRFKRNYNVVDQTNHSIDIAVFGTEDEIESMPVFKVGTVIHVVGDISSYNERTVNVKTVESIEEDALNAWWTNDGVQTSFTDLTIDKK